MRRDDLPSARLWLAAGVDVDFPDDFQVRGLLRFKVYDYVVFTYLR